MSMSATLTFAMARAPKLPENKWDPALQGIKLGSKFDEVISTLGKPQSSEDHDKNLVLFYDGLTIEVGRKNHDLLWVTNVEINNPKWEMNPKIKVGMPKNDIIKILGTPLHQEEREDGRIWIWWWHESSKFDSLFSVTFENEKAIKIMFSEDTSI